MRTWAMLVVTVGCSSKAEMAAPKLSEPVQLSPNVRALVPANLARATTRYPDQHKFDLPNESFVLLQGIDETADGGCGPMLERQYARMSTDREIEVGEVAWQTTLGHKAMYASYKVLGASGAHPNRALAFCDGEVMVGVTIGARSKLSPDEDALFDAIVASLGKP